MSSALGSPVEHPGPVDWIRVSLGPPCPSRVSEARSLLLSEPRFPQVIPAQFPHMATRRPLGSSEG